MYAVSTGLDTVSKQIGHSARHPGAIVRLPPDRNIFILFLFSCFCIAGCPLLCTQAVDERFDELAEDRLGPVPIGVEGSWQVLDALFSFITGPTGQGMAQPMPGFRNYDARQHAARHCVSL